MRSVLRPAGVRSHCNVHVDVHRRPVPTQCGHIDRVPGALSTSIVCESRLGGTTFPDNHLVNHDGLLQIRTKVSCFSVTQSSVRYQSKSHFCCIEAHMLVGLQFHTVLLDTGGPSTRCHCGQLVFSSEHHSGSGCQATPNTNQRIGKGAKGGPSGHCAVATSGDHQPIEHDRSAVGGIDVGVCSLVVYDALFNIVSGFSDCVNILFSQRRGKWIYLK